MPFRLTWEPPHGVYREYFGDVSIDQRKQSFDLICGDSRFDDLRYSITDYLAVQRYEISPTSTAENAAFHLAALATNPRIVIAAVATRPDILATIREFIAYGFTSAPYEVFDTLEAARAWLAQAREPVAGA